MNYRANEEHIERHCERTMDRLNRQLLDGQISEQEYNKAVRSLNDWAEHQYSRCLVSA